MVCDSEGEVTDVEEVLDRSTADTSEENMPDELEEEELDEEREEDEEEEEVDDDEDELLEPEELERPVCYASTGPEFAAARSLCGPKPAFPLNDFRVVRDGLLKGASWTVFPVQLARCLKSAADLEREGFSTLYAPPPPYRPPSVPPSSPSRYTLPRSPRFLFHL